MAAPENDALEDLAYATSEGPSDQWESADPGATDSGDYGDYGDLAAGDAGDYGDYGDYGDAGDLGDFGDAGDLGDPYEPDAADFGDFAGEDPIGVEEAEESVSQTIASMLGAESEDQFFGNLIRGARNLIKKAAPIVGKIARGAAPILRLIPHPIAQGAATVAGVLGKLKAEGASVEDALEAVAEVAARDTRALPIVAGLAARSVLKGTAARLPPAQRQQVARAVTRAAANLVAAGGPTAIRALPKVAASVRRTAANNGTPPPARPRVLVRTVARLAQNPAALRNLSTPSPRARQIIASVRRTGMGNGGMAYGGYGGMGSGGMGSGGTGYAATAVAPAASAGSASPARRQSSSGQTARTSQPLRRWGRIMDGNAARMRGASGQTLARFLDAKRRGLASRARRLVELTPRSVGLRPEDRPFSASAAHFAAANRRLQAIDRAVRERLRALAGLPADASVDDRLLAMAMVEREVDRSRRAFGLFFEVFAQRGTAFARPLAGHDAIARDCYAAVTAAAPTIFTGTILPPVTYLEHGYSPATMRRGVTLARLLGETNPFPLIRIPFDRDRPWQAVFLHEVAHNLQADLGLWVEMRNAVVVRLTEMSAHARVTSVFGRWQKEIFADLAALLLGGPAAAWGMAEFLSHPADKVLTYRPGGAHPTSYLRVPIMAEMLRRMGFAQDAAEMLGVWTRLYNPRRGHRIPRVLLGSAREVIPAVVDEMAFQPKRALAERALVSVIPFGRRDQAAIRRGGILLARGRAPPDLPPRFLVSACRYALEAGAAPHDLGRVMLGRLAPAQGAPSARLATARRGVASPAPSAPVPFKPKAA